MRAILVFLICGLVAGCGGRGGSGSGSGGGSGGSGGGGAEAWRGPVADVTRLSPTAGQYSALLPGAQPSGQVGMSGGFAARIGGTDEAVYGGAHMLADFNAARVDGWVDQLTLQRISLSRPLLQADPQLIETLTGTIDFDGAIQTQPPTGEGLWFDAGYRGTITGPNTTLRITGRTDRGAFLSGGAGLAGYGSVTGTATRDRGGFSRAMALREGKIFVQQQ